MLPRVWRLNDKKLFETAFRRGRNIKAHGFSVFWLASTPNKHTQIGIVVSKKVAKQATKRNLYKRRILASLTVLKDILPIKGYIFVILVAPSIEKVMFGDIKKDLDSILTKF